MREIAPLQTLALRYVGPSTCNPELTFGGGAVKASSATNDSNSSTDATKENSAQGSSQNKPNEPDLDDDDDDASTTQKCPPPPQTPTLTSRLLRSLRELKRPRRPYTGAGRSNANDVDLSHPWILALEPPHHDDNNNGNDVPPSLCIQHGNHAVDCLQLFIDALVESGRAGDNRLGVHSFREWVVAVIGPDAAHDVFRRSGGVDGEGLPSKKRQRLLSSSFYNNDDGETVLPLGSLSLHNYSAASNRTFRSMEMANVGVCLGTLDLTGVHGLTDTILSDVLCAGSFPRIRRLSIKNCRKVTGAGVASLVGLSELTALDVGGCFNIRPRDVVSMVRAHPGTKGGTLDEIYASGLGWTDVDLEALIDATCKHLRGLGVGFSPYISGPGLILTMSKVANTLERLAVPFCEGMDDAAASALGKNLPKLAVLDIRGTKVTSLTGMMDGRVASGAIPPIDESSGVEAAEDRGSKGHLFVLARYSGISKNSLEETMRLHQRVLTCVLDGGGTGEGIRR
ncbi:hypothetical protein HJC23_008434 [Cyclotella cryptica]|uniref:RNI-like protein n=1 Tax=Cyclotella cryptica TaxID=29204 RepID=A0ABD3PXI9_9STRA|eukprot:CCRYP_010725-RA/>CCRYP_010725-RA protein AED:0.38 eAED:0.38 QI:0/-1/0/1/-1/1/1/0/510